MMSLILQQDLLAIIVRFAMIAAIYAITKHRHEHNTANI